MVSQRDLRRGTETSSTIRQSVLLFKSLSGPIARCCIWAPLRLGNGRTAAFNLWLVACRPPTTNSASLLIVTWLHLRFIILTHDATMRPSKPDAWEQDYVYLVQPCGDDNGGQSIRTASMLMLVPLEWPFSIPPRGASFNRLNSFTSRGVAFGYAQLYPDKG
jgi:hypothetical protein